MTTSQRRAPTRAERARARAAIAAAFAALAMTACGGDDGSSPPAPPPPPPPASPKLTVASDASAVASGGQAVGLHATLAGATGTTSWTLSGPGSLSAATGADVSYVPPDIESLDTATTVTVTASADGLSEPVQIALTPASVAGHHWDLVQDASVGWDGVVYRHGQFVATGADGAIATSADGQAWTRHDVATPGALLAVAYGDAAGWVAVDNAGYVTASADGQAWAVQTRLAPQGSQQFVDVHKVAYGNGVYVAAGSHGSYTSTDARTWTAVTPPMMWVAFGNGRFLGSGADANVWTSTDGLHWTTAGPGAGSRLAYGAFGNGVFVAGSVFGNLYASADGTTWTPVLSPSNAFAQHITFTGGRFYVDSGYSSADGTTWTPDTTASALPDLAFSDDASAVAAIDPSTAILESGASVAALSPMATPVGDSFEGLDYVGGKYVAATDYGIKTSTDGLTWSAVTPYPPFPTGFSPSFSAMGVTHAADGTILVLGYVFDGPATQDQRVTFLVSTDGGAHWAYSQTPTILGEAEDLSAQVARDAHGWISASRAGEIAASTDGLTWTAKSALGSGVPNQGLAVGGIAFGNGRYVVVGSGGYAAWSTDAVTWTQAATIQSPGATPAPVTFAHVLFDGTRFIAAGRGGIIATSTDGSAWTTVQTPVTTSLYDIARASSGELIAVGVGGAIVSSVDAVHWTSRSTLSTHTLNTVAAGGDSFVAGGVFGLEERSTH
jgi:hypothetical protein